MYEIFTIIIYGHYYTMNLVRLGSVIINYNWFKFSMRRMKIIRLVIFLHKFSRKDVPIYCQFKYIWHIKIWWTWSVESIYYFTLYAKHACLCICVVHIGDGIYLWMFSYNDIYSYIIWIWVYLCSGRLYNKCLRDSLNHEEYG